MKRETIVYKGLDFRAGEEDGIIEGYIAVWGTVDSYMSEFQKGSFAKTIQERGERIKVLFNHNENNLIGKVMEIREDDTGVFVRAKLTTAVEQSRDVYELIKDGVIDTFSFGFRAVKQSFRAGVRLITEVKLYEVSPVVFEANENAIITDFRNEERSTDFDETLSLRQIYSERYDLIGAIERTLDDIFYDFLYEDGLSSGEAVQLTNDALTKFSAAYSDYTERLINVVTTRSDESVFENPLSEAMFNKFKGKSADEIANSSSLTIEEVRALRSGKTIAAVTKLKEISKDIAKAHQLVRNEAVNSLCSELRSGGFSSAERERIFGLLETDNEKSGSMVESIRAFRLQLETQNKE